MDMTRSRRKGYDSNLSDEQWALVEPMLRRKAGAGRPTRLDLRAVVDAIFHLVRTRCRWQMLPHDYPGWTSVRYYFDKWSDDGTWVELNTQLYARVRVQAGCQPQPMLGLLDSQSVKTTEARGERDRRSQEDEGVQTPTSDRQPGQSVGDGITCEHLLSGRGADLLDPASTTYPPLPRFWWMAATRATCSAGNSRSTASPWKS